jgi:hypothetical protein
MRLQVMVTAAKILAELESKCETRIMFPYEGRALMDPDEATFALHDAEHRAEAVRTGSRWPVTLLTVWGVTTFVAEFATAFLAGPWTLIPVGFVLLLVGWAAVYANRQKVYARGFAGRYMIVVGAFAVLHLAYLELLIWADLRQVTFALIGSLAVAAPLFVGAYIESRRL